MRSVAGRYASACLHIQWVTRMSRCYESGQSNLALVARRPYLQFAMGQGAPFPCRPHWVPQSFRNYFGLLVLLIVMIMLLAVSSGALDQAPSTEFRFQCASVVKLAGNDSSCSFDPGVSKACGHWCLQPEWTSKGAGTGLSCCSGRAGSGASELKPLELLIA